MGINQFKINALICGLVILLAGCASTHEMKDGEEGFWGGGYRVDEISEGEFMITAKTNAAQLTAYGTARKMWEKQANKACGEKPYIEKDIREYDYEHIPAQHFGIFRYIVTVKEGIAICQ